MKNTTQIKTHNDDTLFLFWGKVIVVFLILFFQSAFSATAISTFETRNNNQISDTLSISKEVKQDVSTQIHIASGTILFDGEDDVFVEKDNKININSKTIDKENKKIIAQVEIEEVKKISNKLNLPKQKIEIKPFTSNETAAFSKLKSVAGGIAVTQQIDLKYFISTKIISIILTINDFEYQDIYSQPAISYNAVSQASMSVRPPPFSV